MSDPRAQTWDTAINPRHLLRLTRMRPNGRKYALLACACVRHLFPGVQIPIGLRVLDELERFVAAQPVKGVQTNLWRDVVRRNLPEVPDRLPIAWTRGNGAWMHQFAWRMGSLSQVSTAEINVLFELAFRMQDATARQEAAVEVAELCRRLAPAARPPDKPRLTVEQLRDEILARTSPAGRDAARAHWAGVTDAPTATRRAYELCDDRSARELDRTHARACELIREVFPNPFRTLAVEPEWLVWNHDAVKQIATQIATTGNFAELPILGDALEDAGCTDERLLGHCREPVAHAPGCWALDAVLGKW